MIVGHLREAIAASMARPLGSLIAVTIAAAVCFGTVATAGRGQASAQVVLSQLDDAGLRVMTVRDVTGGAGVTAEKARRLLRVEAVDWLVALSGPEDVRSVALGDVGEPVALRHAHFAESNRGLFAQILAVPDGGALAGGEALRRLGLSENVGLVRSIETGEVTMILGSIEPSSALEFLSGSAVRIRHDAQQIVRVEIIVVGLSHVEAIGPVASIAEELLEPLDPLALRIETSADLVSLQGQIVEEIDRYSSAIVYFVLASGVLLQILHLIVVLSLRKQDLGRRRVLGASRSMVAVMVLLQAGGLAIVGVAFGSTAGTLYVNVVVGQPPAVSFVVSVGILTVLTSLVGAVLPASIAGRRDPIRALRVP